jgi:hypothetical protein
MKEPHVKTVAPPLQLHFLIALHWVKCGHNSEGKGGSGVTKDCSCPAHSLLLHMVTVLWQPWELRKPLTTRFIPHLFPPPLWLRCVGTVRWRQNVLVQIQAGMDIWPPARVPVLLNLDLSFLVHRARMVTKVPVNKVKVTDMTPVMPIWKGAS